MPYCYNAKLSYVLLSKCATTVINQTSKQNYHNELGWRISHIDSKSPQSVVKIPGCLPVKICQVKKPHISLACRQLRWSPANA